jgi:predicted DNA-binding transcriptional regulator AlpA
MKEQDKNEELIGVPLQELWNIKQVSNFLDVPVGTLYQWRHKGYGPPAWRLGRSLRYDAAAVRRWLVEESSVMSHAGG